MEQKLLTALELKVMNLLWDKEEAFVKELIDEWPDDPKPAYNTISTMVRILEDKGFVDHRAHGRSFCYFPTITRAYYRKTLLKDVVKTAFSGSVSNLISTIVDNREDLSPEELDDLKNLIDQYENK